MSKKIPSGITREFVIAGIEDFQSGKAHAFGESTGYDLLFEGHRYPPKAVLGLAAAYVLGEPLEPNDFKGGLRSKCFRVLIELGFLIVAKSDSALFPDEIQEPVRLEGASTQVWVNRYERDSKARRRCIEHYGVACRVCQLEMGERYGPIGEGFIHVHHLTPVSKIGPEYQVNAIRDLRPVCPTCHAMLHRREPPFTIEELREYISSAGSGA